MWILLLPHSLTRICSLTVPRQLIEEPRSDVPVPHIDGLVYDPGSAGGCTIVETDRDGNRIREYVGIAGTATN